MSLIFQNGSRTQSYGPGEKMPALPPQPGFGKPKASPFGPPQPGGNTQYPGGTPQQTNVAKPAGQAQSTPQPSRGTPYSAYAPNSSSSVATNTDGVNRTYNANAYNNASSGNFANNPTSRPAPVSQGATGLGGQKFSDPSQAFAQRDAMIDRLNTNKSQYTANAGVYQGDGPPPASFGQRPQYDFNSLMGQANDMVQQGWTNPFSQGSGGSDAGVERKGPGPNPFFTSSSPGAGGSGGQPPAYGHQIMTGQSGSAYPTGGFPAQPAPGGGQTVTNYSTPGGGQATSTVNFGPVGPPPQSPARPQPAPPPVFGSGFLEGSQGQHYPGRPLGFGARPARQAPASDAISPYAAAPWLPDSRTQLMNYGGPAISTAGNRPPSYNNYGQGFGPGVPILKGPGPLTSSPVTPGSAQPIAPQQPPSGYYPGGEGGFPALPPPERGLRSADDSPTSPEYQKWRSGQAQTMEWRGPEGEAKREADMHRRWMEETGRAPASGDFRPKPGAPQGPRMPYAGGMDYEQGPPVVRPGLTLRPPARRTGMAGYQTTRRR